MLRRIGGGRRYEAMLVWDEHRLAVLVAKVLRPDHATEPAALRDLEREAALLERLAHPVVVRGFGAVLDGRFPHLVLEHLDGPTLDELLERGGALALEQLLPLGLHVASALHYLAAEGIVHLDVKPSNIVMGGPPRLIDLSVARTHRRGRASCARRSAPTPTWRPSKRAPDGRLGPPTDVFGLAATLQTALTGERARPAAPAPRRTRRGRAARGPGPRPGRPPHRRRAGVPAGAARRGAADANDARPDLARRV